MAKRFGFDDQTSLQTQIPIPAEVKPAARRKHAATAGTALDYRIRMDLPDFDVATTSAWRGLELLERHLEAVHRAKHIHKLLSEALQFAYLELKERDAHPLSLARVSVPRGAKPSTAAVRTRSQAISAGGSSEPRTPSP